MTFTGYILYALFFGFLTALIADLKGYDPRRWFYLGMLLGFIATGILMIQPNKPRKDDDASHTISE